MFGLETFTRLTRVKDYLPNSFAIFFLVFLISPQNFISLKTVIVFLANLFITAFIYAFNDVEDAEDDYHASEKSERNPISNEELTKTEGYLISSLLLLIGLFLLSTVSLLVFSLGLALALLGFFYSWKSVRLKSIPIADLVFHIICLGVLQFFITYLAFRSLDLLVIPFLMIIIPSSLIIQVLFEMRDFNVDKKTKINNTIQKLGKFDIKLSLIFLGIIATAGFAAIFFDVSLEYQVLVSLGFLVYLTDLFNILKRSEYL